MKDLITTYKNSSKLVKTLWTITVFVILFVSCMHTYNDILVTAKQGLVFWDCLFSGRLFSFYKDAYIFCGNEYYPVQQYALYPFLYYLIFAIFEFPIWLLEKIFQTNIYNTIFGNLYSKVILLFFIACSLYMFRIVLKELGKKEKEISLYSFVFLSSIILITSTCITSQYDVMNVFLILLGFYYWLKHDTVKFVAVFSISINLKYFGLLFFVPLLLIEEKNVFKLAYKTILAVLPTVILMLIFSNNNADPTGVVGTSIVSSYITKFIVNDIQIGRHQVSLFVLLSILSCMIAYFYRYKDEKEKRQLAIFVLLLFIGSFCLIARIIAYWAVLGVPVFILAVAFSNGNENRTLFFETALGTAITLYQYFFFNWMFCAKTTSAMGILPALFHKHPEADSNIGVDGVLMSLGFGPEVIEILYIFAFAAWFALLYYAYPREKQQHPKEEINDWVLVFRTIMNLGLALLPFVTAVFIYVVYY